MAHLAMLDRLQGMRVGRLEFDRLVALEAGLVRLQIAHADTIAIAVGLVLSEASMFNRRLLTIIALVGLFSELLPFLASIALRRQVRMQELPAEGGPC